VSAETIVTASDFSNIVATESGKVVGYVRNGIYIYKGVPYGDSTAGAHRFMPPRKPKSWEGVRSSRCYGPTAPQIADRRHFTDDAIFLQSPDDTLQAIGGTNESEDCLRINIWTPGIGDGKKRPVMMWIHGGGFVSGSSHEMLTYDGENLARRGDVVVVSINHRLNALGFMDLSQYGEQYKGSGNLGMLDIVAALEWVRDNIVGFGGDASCVTIFGQSGGGDKVCALLEMPKAKGLFHRAIAESRGDPMTLASPELAQRVTDQVVAELGLSRETIQKIHDIPVLELVDAGQRALNKLLPAVKPRAYPAYHVDNSGEPNFTPVIDGVIFPANPNIPRASELSADIPVMIGTTLNEMFNATGHPEYEMMTEQELEHEVRRTFGDTAPQVIKAFRKRTPNAKPFDLWSHIGASHTRNNAIKVATARAALGKAPVYLYWFWWQTPVLDGRPRAYHCAELPFVFFNTTLCAKSTGGGEDARVLSEKMSDTWTNFARTGNPNHSSIPYWPRFSSEAIPTLIFDNDIVMVNAPDREEQEVITKSGCFDKNAHCI
jgi:para-nitrobenzyl esterase